MSTIFLNNVIAAKGYGGTNVVSIYGQGGVKIWEADTGPVPEWYGKSENYNFSQDYMSILPLEDGEIRFWLPEGNSILYSPTGNDSENDWEDPLGAGFTPVETTSNYNVWSIPVTKLQPIYLKKGSTFVYGEYNRIQSQVDYYVRGNMDKSFASSSGTLYNSFFSEDTYLLGAKYLKVYTGASGYGYANSVCQKMFYGCTSLITVPDLPMTTLTQRCYYSMFEGCSSITVSPVLPAINLSQYCYTKMFQKCSNLSYITALSLTEPSSLAYSQVMTDRVANTGIFVMNIDANWTYNGSAWKPNNWTLLYYDTTTGKYYLSDKVTMCDDHGNPIGKDYSRVPFTIVAKSDGNITFNRGYYYINEGSGSGSGDGEGGGENFYEIEYSTDGGTTWETADITDPDLTISVENGDEIMMRYDMGLILDNPDVGGWEPLIGYDGFSRGDAEFEVQGNIMSLVYGDSFIGETTFPSPGINFNGMFKECQTLLNAENLILPATTLTNNCYDSMFSGCTSLTVAPALPATTLADSCYLSMFSGTDLTTAPELPATTLASDCYSNMFSGCGSLTTAPALPVTTLESGCYQNMFSYCGSLTTAPVLPATTLAEMCYWYMFAGCFLLSNITMLATDISADDCLTDWVDGVAATGTFVKAAAMNSLTTGISGIPSGWSIQDAT